MCYQVSASLVIAPHTFPNSSRPLKDKTGIPCGFPPLCGKWHVWNVVAVALVKNLCANQYIVWGVAVVYKDLMRGKKCCCFSPHPPSVPFAPTTLAHWHQKASVMPPSCVSRTGSHHQLSIRTAWDPSRCDILFSRSCLVWIPNPLKQGYCHRR